MTLIKLDIDEKIDIERLKIVSEWCFTTYELTFKVISVKQFKNKWHIILQSSFQILDGNVPYIQTLFGSDYRREMLLTKRLFEGKELYDANILFSRKITKKRTTNYKGNFKFFMKVKEAVKIWTPKPHC